MIDKNFDQLADRYETNIHSSFKGRLRRSVIDRDLRKHVTTRSAPMKILDLGAGLGHYAIEFAKAGHDVTYNELSNVMLGRAQNYAKQACVADAIQWHQGPYQSLTLKPRSLDMVLCHAVLEWLAEPEQVFPRIGSWLKPGGVLSLCFYNPVGLVFHNLLRGNFHYIEQGSQPDDPKSLTPIHAVSLDSVKVWLEQNNFECICVSGIRVFNDYALKGRGGNQSESEILRMELAFSDQDPYRYLARYLHVIARPR